jgi:organic hydroperoxide reductase OsmC/OhrA
MALEATYTTEVAWKGGHRGHLVMGNGPEMDFSAPPDAHGHAGVLTPEDAFVAAANTCVMMMFLWACERFKLDLVSFRCRTEGTKRIELDRTELFTHLRFRPEIVVRAGECEDTAATEKRVRRALASARKYSLVANSVKSEIAIEPAITILTGSVSEEAGGISAVILEGVQS